MHGYHALIIMIHAWIYSTMARNSCHHVAFAAKNLADHITKAKTNPPTANTRICHVLATYATKKQRVNCDTSGMSVIMLLMYSRGLANVVLPLLQLLLLLPVVGPSL